MWATGFKGGQCYFRIISKGNVIDSFWSQPSKNHNHFEKRITSKFIGGFTVQAIFIKDGQTYHFNRFINVKRPHKKLNLQLVKDGDDTYDAGSIKKWSLKINNIEKYKTGFEGLVTLYDSSLENSFPHDFFGFENFFWKGRLASKFIDANSFKSFRAFSSKYYQKRGITNRIYPHFSSDIVYFNTRYRQRLYKKSGDQLGLYNTMNTKMHSLAPRTAMMKSAPLSDSESEKDKLEVNVINEQLKETALFIPHLNFNKNGIANIDFTLPIKTGEWKMMSFVHGKGLESGKFETLIVTSKKLMVTPHMPRFIREGDTITLSSKVINGDKKKIKGKVELKLYNVTNKQEVTKDFIKGKNYKRFNIRGKREKDIFWKVKANKKFDYNKVYYEVLVYSDKNSKAIDQKVGLMEIPTNLITVKDSIPLVSYSDPDQKITTNRFILPKLLNLKDKSIRSKRLEVQLSLNPEWYALTALPFICETKYDNNDQIMNSLFSHLVALRLLEQNPKLKGEWSQWIRRKYPKIYGSQLTNKHGNIIEKQTPWKSVKNSEEEVMKNLDRFFNKSDLIDRSEKLRRKLVGRIGQRGGWSWFPGGPESRFITIKILQEIGHLLKMGNNVSEDLYERPIKYLDDEVLKWAQKIKKDRKFISSFMSKVLYTRSLFIKKIPLKGKVKELYRKELDFVEKSWNLINNLKTEAILAMGLWNFGRLVTGREILKSIKERSLFSKEKGRYFAFNEAQYSIVGPSSLETQTVIIDLYSSIDGENARGVKELKDWLVMQKKVRIWGNRFDSVRAVYSLLKTFDKNHDSGEIMVSLGEQEVINKKWSKDRPLLGSKGFLFKEFKGNAIAPYMGEVTIKQSGEARVMGGLYWHYETPLNKLRGKDQSKVNIQKELYVKKFGKKGEFLVPISKSKVSRGDLLVVKLKVKIDRPMDFLHIKDMRPAGVEPIDISSRYYYKDGIVYYQTTKDTETHLFIENISTGTHIFKYEVRAFHNGVFSSGAAFLKSFYAPEFSSYSKSERIKIN
jgi:hypothetical protein